MPKKDAVRTASIVRCQRLMIDSIAAASTKPTMARTHTSTTQRSTKASVSIGSPAGGVLMSNDYIRDQYWRTCVNYGYEPMNIFVHNNEPYAELTDDQVHQLLNDWENPDKISAPIAGWVISDVPLPKIGQFVKVYTVFDNTDGQMWMEDFYSKAIALHWLSGEYEDVDDLYNKDRRIMQSRITKAGKRAYKLGTVKE